jgi:hypothetical protein
MRAECDPVPRVGGNLRDRRVVAEIGPGGSPERGGRPTPIFASDRSLSNARRIGQVGRENLLELGGSGSHHPWEHRAW